MPTSSKVKHQVLDVLSENETQGTIYELGSGWGTLAFAIAKRFPKCQVTAYENSLVPYIHTQIYKFFIRTNNLNIKRENFFNALLSQANTIVCYLSTDIMVRLQPKLESELQKETLVVTNTFALPSWTPQQTIETEDLYRTKIHIYVNQNKAKKNRR